MPVKKIIWGEEVKFERKRRTKYIGKSKILFILFFIQIFKSSMSK